MTTGFSMPGVVVVRGGGDLATGVVWRLHRAGFDVLVTELPDPLTVRRTVAVSSAVRDGVVDIEGLVARRVDDVAAARACWARSEVPVLVAPTLADLAPFGHRAVVVDARVAKRNIDTARDDADLVVALGPGFVAGPGGDCHAVVETRRGARLGRVIWSGAAAADTGTPGLVAGHGAERVLRAPVAGEVRWQATIGDVVVAGQVLGRVGTAEVGAPFPGVVRGLVAEGVVATVGLKIGDVDPRSDVSCHEMSDKALAVGGGVAEAVSAWCTGRVVPA